MFADPVPLTTQLNDQLEVPVARVQVTPPLVDTSTPDSRPPPESAAVPAIVIGVTAVNDAPWAGAVIGEVGGATSVDAVVATRPDCRVSGCAPMSAKRLTVACFMRTS